MKPSERARIEEVETLAHDWAVPNKPTLRFQRANGSWQTLARETYDRDNGAPLLLINRERRTVLLTRRFRYSAFVHGATDLLIAACASLHNARAPEAAVKDKVEEELGIRVSAISKVFESYLSPGSVTEKLYFFVAHYAADDRLSARGEVEDEGLGVVELTFYEALAMIDRGDIVDGKTIMLLLYAQWKKLL